MNISTAALFESRHHGTPLPTADQIFARPQPLPGVLPAGMAMDAALPSVASFTNWAMSGVYHEGLVFLGYPYLAELAQRAEYRMVSEKRAEHATRKWIKLRGPAAKIKAIDAEFRRLGAKSAFRTSITNDGLFGRSQIFLDFGDAENDTELNAPLLLDPRKINKLRPLKRLKTVEPVWSYPAPYNSSNPLNEGFYKPAAWYIYGKTVHDSRMLTFIGREVPDMLKPAYAFGGLSMTQLLKPYVDNWLRARQSSSDLLNAFSTMVLKTDMSSALAGGTGASLYNRVDMFNATRTNRGTMVVSKDDEELENVAVPLSGVADLTQQALNFLSYISGIPQILLLGDSPTGLNASSDGEIRTFYTDIKSNEQEHTAQPHVQMLLEVVQLSLFDEIDPEITWEWEPLWEESAKDKAETDKLEAETHKNYVDMGAVSNDEVREAVAAEEDGPYHAVDLSGPAPEPEPEDDPTDMPKPKE